MLHTETVEAGTLALIKRLSQDAALHNFDLVGGTALSLQLGHRKSIDLDFFSTRPFDARATARLLSGRHQAADIVASTNTLLTTIDGIKTTFISHQYPMVGRLDESDGLRLASLEDIGAMKLNAIVNNGRRLKDYVDMHFLLKEKNLDQLLNAYTAKYSDASPDIAKRALLYHKDIRFDTRIDLTNGQFNWADVVKRLKEAVAHPNRAFQDIKMGGVVERKQEENARRIKKGRNR